MAFVARSSLLGGTAACICFCIFLLALCLWPPTSDLVCLVPLCSLHSPGQVPPCFHAWTPFYRVHVAGKAAFNTQAGPKSPSSKGFFDSGSSDASIPMASASKAGPLPSTSPSPAAATADFASQPQMADLPKHGKPAADNAAAAPPKVRILACIQYFCWRYTEIVQCRNEVTCMMSASVLRHSIMTIFLSFLS